MSVITSEAKSKMSFGSKIIFFIKRHGKAYLMLAPFAILLLVFNVAPVIVAMVTSLTNYNMLQPSHFVGLNNYKLLFLDDKIFLTAVKNTLTLAVVIGPLSYAMCFIMAWVINQLKMRNVFALAFYAPSITSAIAMSAVWLYFFSPDRYGLINNFLINMGLIIDPILWNQDKNVVMTAITIITIWMSMGNGFLVFLAGLQNISREYYEAAAIDGLSNRFQELTLITLPMMKPQLLFGAINAIVGAFSVYDIPAQFAGDPSPNYIAHTIIAHMRDYAFTRFQMGYASAIAFMLFITTFLFGRVIFRVLSSRDE